MRARKPVGVYVSPEVDRQIEYLVVDSGATKSELYELGARLLLELVRHGEISEATRQRVEEIRRLVVGARG